MRTTFDDLIADVEALEDRLRRPDDFFHAKQESYHETARQIARRILIAAMPQGENREQWRRKAERVADRVTAELMLGVGMLLGASSGSDPDGHLSPKEDRPSEQQITHADVVQWIEAGQAGIPGGKRITRDDEAFIRQYGIKAKATVVMRAYYSQQPIASYVRLRRAIQKFMFGAEEVAGEPLLEAIAAAWMQHFSARLNRDLRSHVAEVVREF